MRSVEGATFFRHYADDPGEAMFPVMLDNHNANNHKVAGELKKLASEWNLKW